MLAMLNTRQKLLERRPVTPEFICHHHPRHVVQTLQYLLEKPLGRLLIVAGWQKDSQDLLV